MLLEASGRWPTQPVGCPHSSAFFAIEWGHEAADNLESEARLAAAALGLYPGLGVLHVDSGNRDSLALDLLEPVRPQVDSSLLDRITREPLSRQWFFEQRDGNCRLMAPFAVRLSETAMTWRRAVAPIAEW